MLRALFTARELNLTELQSDHVHSNGTVDLQWKNWLSTNRPSFAAANQISERVV